MTLAAAAAVGLLGVVAVEASEAGAGIDRASCPAGQIIDDEDAGYQCQSQCPAGMMIDAETDVCVAPPGVPPPPLSAAVITKQSSMAAQ